MKKFFTKIRDLFSNSDKWSPSYWHLDADKTREALEKNYPKLEEKSKELNTLWINLANLIITVDTTVLFGSFVLLDYKKVAPIPWEVYVSWLFLLLAICFIIVGKITDLGFKALMLKKEKKFIDGLLKAIHENKSYDFSIETCLNFASIKWTAFGFILFLIGILLLASGIVLLLLPKPAYWPIVVASLLSIGLMVILLMEWYKFENN